MVGVGWRENGYDLSRMPGPPWLYSVVAALLLGGGAVVCAWALFADPPGRKRRCPKCWHDMAGVPGRVCPECGHDARFEANLHRWHRRYRWLALGVLLVGAAWVAWVVPAVRRGGWIAAVPSPVLLAVPEGGPRALSMAANGELLQRAAAGLLSAGQLQAMVDRLAPQLLRTRSVWPTGTPIRYEAATVWGSGRLGTVSLRAIGGPDATPPLPEWPRPELTSEQVWTDHLWTLPAKEAGKHELKCEVVVARPRVGKDGGPVSGPPSEVWRGTVRRTILVAGSAGEVMTARGGANLDEFVRERLRPRLVRLPASGTYVISTDRPRGEWVDGVTLALRIEVMREGRVVALARRVYPASGREGLFNAPAVLEGDARAVAEAANPTSAGLAAPETGAGGGGQLSITYGPPYGSDVVKAEPGGWVVRVSGDAELALRDLGSGAYWDGAYEIALDALVNPPPPPPARAGPALEPGVAGR